MKTRAIRFFLVIAIFMDGRGQEVVVCFSDQEILVRIGALANAKEERDECDGRIIVNLEDQDALPATGGGGKELIEGMITKYKSQRWNKAAV